MLLRAEFHQSTFPWNHRFRNWPLEYALYLRDHGNKNITDDYLAQVVILLLQNDPNDLLLWWDLAVADHHIGNDMQAIQALTAAKVLAPRNPTLNGKRKEK